MQYSSNPLYPANLKWSRNGKILFMNTDIKLDHEYDHEIEKAITARMAGNEAMARVCARRAVGIILGEYLIHRGYTILPTSAIDRLLIFISLPNVGKQSQEIASHFLLKVDPDFNFPEAIDLISDARWLRESVLLENTD